MNSKKTERIIRQRVEPSLCFTVRDAYAHALLNALEIPNSYLPCSAVWASKMWNIAPAEQRPYLILVPPSPRHTPKRIGRRRIPRRTRFQQFADRWNGFYTTLQQNGYNVRVLCHAYREYTALPRCNSARSTLVSRSLLHAAATICLCPYGCLCATSWQPSCLWDLRNAGIKPLGRCAWFCC